MTLMDNVWGIIGVIFMLLARHMFQILKNENKQV